MGTQAHTLVGTQAHTLVRACLYAHAPQGEADTDLHPVPNPCNQREGTTHSGETGTEAQVAGGCLSFCLEDSDRLKVWVTAFWGAQPLWGPCSPHLHQLWSLWAEAPFRRGFFCISLMVRGVDQI